REWRGPQRVQPRSRMLVVLWMMLRGQHERSHMDRFRRFNLGRDRTKLIMRSGTLRKLVFHVQMYALQSKKI
ncbi:MAG: hypothetical protein KDH90_25910, partial [Anaerolineae bacterium]|nr:hypothetical protein [Anaerolineae bacterium]